MINANQPIEILQQPMPAAEVAADMQAFEDDFGVPSVEAQANLVGMDASEQIAEEQAVAMGGFDPALMAMYFRATPGSEFAKNIEKLMVTDFVVRNSVEAGLVEGYNINLNLLRQDEEDKSSHKKAKVYA